MTCATRDRLTTCSEAHMYIVRYANISTGEIRVGRASGELVEPLPVQTLSDLLAFRLADLRALMSSRFSRRAK